MKSNFTYKNFLLLLLLFSACAGMSCTVTENMSGTEYKKIKSIRKEKVVKIYPDLVKKLMHVKNIEDASLDFFVFDQQGTLIRHMKMEEGEHKKIAGLNRGAYVYQVFKGDEMSESGKLNIK